MRYTLNEYWGKVYSWNKSDIERMFAPLHKLKKPNEGQRLRIMEIGIGEGLNLAFYPPNCDVIGIDAEGGVEVGLRENIAKYDSLRLETFIATRAEDAPHIDDGSIDAVICTLVLCSVEDPLKVVKEIKRLLRNGGVFVFWEHISGTNNKWVARKQWLINEIWNILCGNFGKCHLTRNPLEYIEASQFSSQEFHTITLPVWDIMSTTLFGNATK